jgi:hypothetical protein
MRAPVSRSRPNLARPPSAPGADGDNARRVVLVGKSTSGRLVRHVGTTDGQGNYEFADLPAGTYIVMDNPPASGGSEQ